MNRFGFLVFIAALIAGCSSAAPTAEAPEEVQPNETSTTVGIGTDPDPDVDADAGPSTATTDEPPADRVDAAEVEIDTTACPPEPADDGPIRIGVNGGGFTGSRHIEGLQAALDEATGEGGVDGRPLELVTAIEEQSDSARSQFHLGELLDRGDLHAIVPWSGWPDPTSIAGRFENECVSGLFWMAAPAPTATWVVPGLDDPRAEMAVIAAWLAQEVEAEHVVVLPLDWPSEVSIGESLVASLQNRSIAKITISPRPIANPTPLIDDLGPANAVQPIDAVVIPTPDGQCVDVAVEVRALLPEAVVIVRNGCEPFDNAKEMAFDGVIRTRWLDDEAPADGVGISSYQQGLATGRALMATIRAATELDGGVTRANILRSARTLRTVLPGMAAGVSLSANGPGDLFVRESAVMDVYEVDPPSPQQPGWHQVGPVIEADGTTPMTEIDWAQPPVTEEALPCAAPDGRPSITTSHWFGEEGTIDPLADVVLSVNHVGLDEAPTAMLRATGADGKAIELPMALGGRSSACDGELSFDIQPGRIAEVNDLRQPVTVVFDIDGSLTTLPVQWPDDFPQEPPFDPIKLDLAD